MWTRQELKARGKAAFKRNYWKSVVAGVVVLALTGASAGSGSRASGGTEELTGAISQSGLSVAAFVGILLGILGVGLLISTAINAFLRNPLQVGTDRFFLKNTQEPAGLQEMIFAFQSGNFLKIVAAKFLANLFIFLWCLLLVIPGIIKSLEYLMVGYILADNPDIQPMDALRKSKQMMQGHKWNAFVLGLSFLGWEILSLLTFGLLDVFYVRPYIEATYAELYLALKQ